MVNRGEVWWASITEPAGSGPGFRRPVLIVSDDTFNGSKIATVVAAVITSNLRLAEAPGNVRLPAGKAGLSKASVVNVSQLITLDKRLLTSRAGKLARDQMEPVNRGLRLVLNLL
jgi:mRNA interferase MazF